jgi:transposase
VFIDESCLNTKLTRLYGRSPVGERCLSSAPQGHRHTTTLVAALRTDGLTAPWMLDGAMNGEAFLTYVREVLGPHLRPGDLVICDNLATHKSSGVERAIADRGASILYLPAYSPDLNPIEMVFSKLKALLKHTAARTLRKLVRAVAIGLDAFSATECSNFIHHCGYVTA